MTATLIPASIASYTITRTIGDGGSFKGDVIWVVRFHTGPMAGSHGNDTCLRDLKEWIRRMGYEA
jgi:hypothetical protein